MTVVIKRDERKEEFDEMKLRMSIAAAAEEADISADGCLRAIEAIGTDVIGYASGQEEGKSSDLRDMILSGLESLEPMVAQSLRNYDRGSKGLA